MRAASSFIRSGSMRTRLPPISSAAHRSYARSMKPTLPDARGPRADDLDRTEGCTTGIRTRAGGGHGDLTVAAGRLLAVDARAGLADYESRRAPTCERSRPQTRASPPRSRRPRMRWAQGLPACWYRHAGFIPEGAPSGCGLRHRSRNDRRSSRSACLGRRDCAHVVRDTLLHATGGSCQFSTSAFLTVVRSPQMALSTPSRPMVARPEPDPPLRRRAPLNIEGFAVDGETARRWFRPPGGPGRAWQA